MSEEDRKAKYAEECYEIGTYFFFDAKDPEMAEKYLKEATRFNHLHAELALGQLYAAMLKYDEAEKLLKPFAEAGNEGALNNLGYLEEKKGEYKKASEYYEKMIKISDDRETVLMACFSLARLYAEEVVEKKEYGKNTPLLGLSMIDYVIKNTKNEEFKEKCSAYMKKFTDDKKNFNLTLALAILMKTNKEKNDLNKQDEIQHSKND